jgi:hypothetical protein
MFCSDEMKYLETSFEVWISLYSAIFSSYKYTEINIYMLSDKNINVGMKRDWELNETRAWRLDNKNLEEW